MSAPPWDELARWAVVIVGVLASFTGALWTTGRIFRAWMRNEARDAADRVSAEVKALAEKLATNDFPHVEKRIEQEAAQAREDRAAPEGRIDKRIEGVEGRIMAAIGALRRPEAAPSGNR